MVIENMPNLALSIMQPWAWLIVNGWKDIENRDWPTRFRGRFRVHAGKKIDRDAMASLVNGRHPVTGEPFYIVLPREFERGGIIGEADIVDCIDHSNSEWFVGRYGFALQNARAVPFQPCRGMLGFFKPAVHLPRKAADVLLELANSPNCGKVE